MKRTKLTKVMATILTIITMATLVPTMSAAAATTNTNAQIICNDSLYDSNKELCDRLVEGLNNLEEEIYVGDLAVNPAQLGYIMKTVIRTHPELFFVNSKQFAAASNETGIEAIVPFYLGEKSEIEIQRKKFDARVNEILALVTDDMSDFDKALIFHDEIALNCTYTNDDSTGIKNVSAYNALVDGKANCQGYTEAYSYLLLLTGVTTEIVESPKMVHIWNNVCIDGQFYNVDVTWDDPQPNKQGHVNHKFFLLSDEAVINNGNYGFAAECCVCDSKKYDNANFHDIDTRFCRIGNDFYAINNKNGSEYQKSLIKYNTATLEATVLKTFDYKWLAGENKYWANAYMSLEEHNDILYFNSPDGVYTYDVNTGEMNAVQIDGNAAEVGSAVGHSYYGIVIKGNEIYVATSSNPNVESNLTKIGECVELPVQIGESRSITVGSNQKVSVVFGDADMDGKVKITDATMIQKYIADLATLNEQQRYAADVNKDGVINILDATEIQRYIAR